MKTTFSVFLALLVMLNVFGYYGIFLGLQYKNSRDVTSRLHAEDYNEAETTTIKIPLSVPYMGNTAYEQLEGEFEYNGEFFHLVKQKLFQDTLYIVCIRDQQHKEINQALADYVKTFTENYSGNSSQSKAVPSFIKDFLATQISIESSEQGWIHVCGFGITIETPDVSAITINVPPPRG
jgi:hypothetical protein